MKIDDLAKMIDKDDFISYYSTHTRTETADHFKIKDCHVKGLSKKFEFKKSYKMIGESVTRFYKNNNLVTVHLPGDTDYIKVNENDVDSYLKMGYVKGYEMSPETKKRKIEKCKKTKLERHNNENYNNSDQCKKTKLERYGDSNYNNKDQIKETQFLLYGGFAFNDKEKYESTMMERYGCKHNWSSDDPQLNGRRTMYDNAGSKDLHYKNVMEKGRKTKLELYSDEFYSNPEKRQKTMLERFGYSNYMLTEDFRKKTVSSETRQKALNTRRKNKTFNTSNPEDEVEKILIDCFGKDDVIRNYQDSRYKDQDNDHLFLCDFYIKSKDLFIELNLFPTHGTHPFDSSNQDDMKLLDILNNNKTKWNLACIDTWVNRDPKKFKSARDNDLNYLVIYPDKDYRDILNIIEEFSKC